MGAQQRLKGMVTRGSSTVDGWCLLRVPGRQALSKPEHMNTLGGTENPRRALINGEKVYAWSPFVLQVFPPIGSHHWLDKKMKGRQLEDDQKDELRPEVERANGFHSSIRGKPFALARAILCARQ